MNISAELPKVFSYNFPSENPLCLPPNALAPFGKSRVTAAQVSPDGKLIAAASRIGVWLYDAHTYHFLSLMAVEGIGLISEIAFSPDSTQIATGDWDGLTRLWHIDTGEELASFVHKDWVTSIAFSNDGKHLATGSRDGSATLWDVDSQTACFTISHEERVANVLFSPDSQRVATGSWDASATLWELETGEHLVTFSHQRHDESVTFASGNVKTFNEGGIQHIAFSPDGSYFVTSGRRRDKNTRLWEIETGKQLWTIPHDASVEALVFSPTGEYVATGAQNGQAHLWEIATGTPRLTVTHDKSVEALTFSADGLHFATGGADGIVNVWQVNSGEKVTCLEELGSVTALQYLPNSALLIGTDAAVEVWFANQEQITTLPHPQDDWGWHHVRFSPDGHLLAGMAQDSTITLWDVASGEPIKTHEEEKGYSLALAFSTEGCCVGMSKAGNTLKFWDGEKVMFFRHEQEVVSAIVSPNASLVATGSRNGEVHLWHIETQECWQTLSGHTGQIQSLAFSPDGTLLVSGGGTTWETQAGEDGIVYFFVSGESLVDTTASVWEVATGKHIVTLENNWIVSGVAFSPDGKYLATSVGKTVTLWCTKTWQSLVSLDTVRVESLTFSPSGTRLAIGGTWPENSIQLWDVKTAQRIAEFSGHKSDVEVVAFSPDNRLLASGGFDGVIYLWDMTPYL